jgi:hypothetical protein
LFCMAYALCLIKVKLSDCQRVVLLSYDETTKLVSFRHYLITLNPVGVSKNVKRLTRQHVLPNLNNLSDISQFILRFVRDKHYYYCLLTVKTPKGILQQVRVIWKMTQKRW